MELSLLLKFAHVCAAILWVGGGFAMIFASMVLAARSPAETQLSIVRAITLLAPRLYVPASMVTLASGVALLFVAGWGWQPFTVFGLAGIIFTAAFGAVVLGPACDRVLDLGASQGAAAAIPELRRVQRLAVMDYCVLFGIVFLMVVKPGWQDLGVLIGLAAVVALAAFASLRPLPRSA